MLLKKSRPALISLGVHLVLIAMLTMINISSVPSSKEITLSWAEDKPAKEILIFDLDIREPEEGKTEEIEEVEIFENITEDISQVSYLTDMVEKTMQSFVASDLLVTKQSLQLLPDDSGPQEKEEKLDSYQELEYEKKEEENGSFFGIKAQGKRVVFVLDASRSMNARLRWTETTDRWDRLVEELHATIRGLNEDVVFSIILFADKFWEIPSGMATANPRNKQVAAVWVSHFELEPKTNPFPALRRAFRLNPEVIYFLTDGAFDEEVVHQTMKLNKARRKNVIINTIGIGNSGGNEMLEIMARETGGEFVFIDR